MSVIGYLEVFVSVRESMCKQADMLVQKGGNFVDDI